LNERLNRAEPLETVSDYGFVADLRLHA